MTFDKKEFLGERNELLKARDALSSKGIDWFSLRYHKRPTALATAWDIGCGLILGLLIVLKKKIDIIHARSYVAAFIALGLKVLTRRRFVFDMRGYWADERIEGNIWPQGSFLYKSAKSLERTFLRHADFIVVLTENMKMRLRKDYGLENKPIEVIPTCVDLQEFQILRSLDKDAFLPKSIKDRLENKELLVYLGSLGTVYMLEEMFDFFSILRQHFGSLHFLLLTQSKDEIVRDIALKKGVREDDFTVASVRHSDVYFWLNLGKIAIAFYKPAFSAIGRAPTKIGEYLACGLPTIVNKGVGDIDKIVAEQKVGIAVERFSQQGYREALSGIKNLLKDQQGLKEKCRNVAQKYFSLETGVDNYFKIYQILKN
jgi:glycosyltransferase involved in cell wall biosynthesis